MKARSVGESSTIMIFLIAIFILLRLRSGVRCSSISLGKVSSHRIEEVFLGERLGEVLVGAHQAAPRAVEHAGLRRQHDDRDPAEPDAFLDKPARWVSVQ